MDDGNNLRTTNPQLTGGGAGACRVRMRGDAIVDDSIADNGTWPWPAGASGMNVSPKITAAME